MPTSHLGVAEKNPSLAQSRDFLDLEEPPAARETPSGSQVHLVDYDRARPADAQYNNNYTHQYQPGLKQARLVDDGSSSVRPTVGGMPRRRSTNYIDALHSKAKSEATMNSDLQQSLSKSTGAAPIFKPSYTAETAQEIAAAPVGQTRPNLDDPARADYYRTSFSSRGGERPDLGRKKSSFQYEDFKKDVYDRLNMFDKK